MYETSPQSDRKMVATILFLGFMLALKRFDLSNSFHIFSTTRIRRSPKQTFLYMSPLPKQITSRKKVDFSGLTDELTTRIANDLNLDKFANNTPSNVPPIVKMTPKEIRELLANFVEYHHDAERQVAYLVLQHLGISKSVFLTHQKSSITYDSCVDSITHVPFNLNQTMSLEHNEDSVIPHLCPVAWLSDDSWSLLPYNDKLGIMEHLLNGKFQSEHVYQSQGRTSFFPTAHSFRSNAITFGKGIDRVVLGNGSRRVLVIVGIHGNEPCGVEAVKILLQRKALFLGDTNVKAQDLDKNDNWKQPMEELFKSMTIEILIGNPCALARNTRFIKKNLNRLFDIHILCNDASAEEEGYTYELQRAKLIVESIRCADFVLDIHSTSADVGSFALPSSMELSEELAECLPVKYTVESLAHMTLDGGTTVDCALLHNVPAICVECGQHFHQDIVARAAAVISSFLALQMLPEDGLQPYENKKKLDKPLAMRCEYAERVEPGFEWLNQFPEFSFIHENTPVFRTNKRGDVFAPEGGAYLVMPTSCPVEGEEALFWASAK